MTVAANISKTQLRGYQVQQALFGHEIEGISCTTIAKRLSTDKVVVLRDLQTLEAAGLAEQLPNKNWRISPMLGREALKILQHIEQRRARLDETLRRYGATV